MKATFENSIAILIKAYFDGTLEHANCSACAVGNLVAHAKGVRPTLDKDTPDHALYRFSDQSIPKWHEVFCSNIPGYQFQSPWHYEGEAKDQIDSTGYSWQDLARIELAFESVSDRVNTARQSAEYKDRQMFAGLMKVVDVLAEIHGVDLTVKENAKLLFVKP